MDSNLPSTVTLTTPSMEPTGEKASLSGNRKILRKFVLENPNTTTFKLMTYDEYVRAVSPTAPVPESEFRRMSCPLCSNSYCRCRCTICRTEAQWCRCKSGPSVVRPSDRDRNCRYGAECARSSCGYNHPPKLQAITTPEKVQKSIQEGDPHPCNLQTAVVPPGDADTEMSLGDKTKVVEAAIKHSSALDKYIASKRIKVTPSMDPAPTATVNDVSLADLERAGGMRLGTWNARIAYFVGVALSYLVLFHLHLRYFSDRWYWENYNDWADYMHVIYGMWLIPLIPVVAILHVAYLYSAVRTWPLVKKEGFVYLSINEKCCFGQGPAQLKYADYGAYVELQLIPLETYYTNPKVMSYVLQMPYELCNYLFVQGVSSKSVESIVRDYPVLARRWCMDNGVSLESSASQCLGPLVKHVVPMVRH